ncbi:putative pentatricopeptide [Rosa chinensis]|uniref:Putative pentatricopeptide n=1 Tax=Rosa chinensis TaxID=74649 RepID=A0A2P6PTF6_ROSCH|nr:pentatricopeptide repeat-containing protein At1g62350 isoform X1 [Rosa chinensis]PRQ25222.1 putative pentatricopeptide [Rosa chinensis]
MRPSSALQTVTIFSSLPKTLIGFNAQPHCQYLQLSKPKRCLLIITMRDRSKNPRPLQKGRNLSIEAIQTIQALKRAKKNEGLMEQVFNSKFRRLLKLDMMAVLKDLLRQNECFLALKVFEDIRKEYWYKPQVLLYADMIKVMASNELFEQVENLCLCLKQETNLQPDIEGFNALLTALLSFNLPTLAMECYYLMKGVGCEPDRSSFRILIKGLESVGETGPLGIVRQDAQNLYGESLEFLEEDEEMAVSQ